MLLRALLHTKQNSDNAKTYRKVLLETLSLESDFFQATLQITKDIQVKGS